MYRPQIHKNFFYYLLMQGRRAGSSNFLTTVIVSLKSIPNLYNLICQRNGYCLKKRTLWVVSFWFYGTSTVAGYLIPNPFLYTSTVLFPTIQFSINTQFSSIWFIDRTQSGATISGQSVSGSDGNEGVLCIPQSSSITGTSPSDCFASYPWHSSGEVLPLSRDAVGVFYSPSLLDQLWVVCKFIWLHKLEKGRNSSLPPSYR